MTSTTTPVRAIRGGTVVTMDDAGTIGRRDVLIGPDGRIAAVAPPGPPADGEQTLDARGLVVVPGLVQGHVHLCQTLFRGLAEDRPLLRWLRERIWPLEGAHDAASLGVSARLGLAELLLGGTTAVLDMGTVHHTEALFQAAAESGIRYCGGKAMMDAGVGIPPGLQEETEDSLSESDRLARQWHGEAGGRLRYAYCPRFVLSCSASLMQAVAERSRAEGWLVHTHASEQLDEAETVRRQFGRPNIAALARLGLLSQRSVVAHCVWPEPLEVDHLAGSGASVVHCPSCNLKLSSGIAPIAAYLRQEINVAVGADGAPANNRLDGWEELRLAALLAKVQAGPEALPARQVFFLATRGGARALGLESEIGSIEPGKYADLVLIDLQTPHAAGAGEGPEGIFTQLVYSARAADVRTVLVGGRILVEEGRLTTLDVPTVLEDAQRERRRVLARAGISDAGADTAGYPPR
ncbi:MAG TPA: 5'-deoxyadenosine deaminase [Chloroflexota bacterium]|nr:5'-deoxyadenosine deaminase [Chloroflexota bacterium]